MKYIKGAKTLTQYCLDVKPLLEVMSDLPKDIVVKELQYEGWNKSKWKKLLVPEYLKKTGVGRVRECGHRTNITGTLQGFSAKEIDTVIKRLGKNFQVEPENFMIKKMLISDGANEAMFKKTRKEIKFPNDKRRKVQVFALANYKGDREKLLARLSAKKVACQYVKSEKNVVVCSEVR